MLCLFAATALALGAGGACFGSPPPLGAGQLPLKDAGKTEPLYVTLSGNHLSGWADAKNSHHRGKYRPGGKAFLMPQKITMVKVVNDRGVVAERHVLPLSAGDLIVAGLMKRLGEAGYTVQVVRKLPEKGLGLDISLVSTQLEQRPWLLGWKGRCEMRVRLEVWQNGRSLAAHVFATTRADSSYTAQRLLSGLLTQAASDITSQAMADMTGGVENIGAAVD